MKRILSVVILSLGIAACAPAAPAPPGAVVAPLTTPTAPGVEKEKAVLEQTAQSVCNIAPGSPFGPPQISVKGQVSQLSCVFAAGHSTDASIERFASANDAQKAFALLVEDRAGTPFHDYAAARWDERAAQVNRYFVWQAERWVFKVHSFDDTASASAPDPAKVAETIYQSAKQVGLLSK
jgi:hypothetical protein